MSLILAALSIGLVVWLVILLVKLKKIQFRFMSFAAGEIEKTKSSRSREIEELQDKIRGFEAGWRFFFEEAQVYNVIIGMDGRILDMNRAFLNIFDREKESLQGKDLPELAVPGRREQFSQYLIRHREDKYTSEQEVEFPGKKGARFILFGERHLTVVENFVPRGVLLSGVDITALRQFEAAQENLKQKLALSARMEALGIMAGGIAHDLKNLFNPVLTYPDFISERLPADSELRVPVLRIKDAASRAADLVQNFLTLARRGRTDLASVDVNGVVRAYIQSMGFKTLESRFPRTRVGLRLAEELPPVMGQAPQLLCAIMNLVRNGCEAMESGGELTIATFLKKLDAPHRGLQQIPRGEYVVVQISDSGKGIKRKSLDRRFIPFSSGKEMGNSGSGLGLVVVAGVIEDHHGYMDVASEVGKGTIFTVYLRPVQKPAGPGAAARPGPASILVVDNSDDDRKKIVRQLILLGHETAAVADGEEAYQYVKAHPVDLILMDLKLDYASGLDVFSRITEISPRQKCIVLSGCLDHQALERAAQLGIPRCLEKPVETETLGRAVREELERGDLMVEQ
ncbi:MAG: response regulator [PVC group bacterium]